MNCTRKQPHSNYLRCFIAQFWSQFTWSWKCHCDTTFHTSFTILHNILLLAHTASMPLLHFCKRNCDNHLRFKFHEFMHIISNFTLPSSLHSHLPILPKHFHSWNRCIVYKQYVYYKLFLSLTHSHILTHTHIHTHTHTHMRENLGCQKPAELEVSHPWRIESSSKSLW